MEEFLPLGMSAATQNRALIGSDGVALWRHSFVAFFIVLLKPFAKSSQERVVESDKANFR